MGIEKPVKSPEPWEEYGFVWGSKRSKKSTAESAKASFFSWLRGCLRESVWMRYPPKFIFKNSRCSTNLPKDYTGRARSGSICALSGKWTPKSMLEVDHITGVGRLNEWEDVEGFIKHLCTTSANMQLVDKQAHKIKSYADRSGMSYDEAVIEKEVIRLLKKENKVEMENMLTNDTLFVGESNKRNRLRKIIHTGTMST